MKWTATSTSNIENKIIKKIVFLVFRLRVLFARKKFNSILTFLYTKTVKKEDARIKKFAKSLSFEN